MRLRTIWVMTTILIFGIAVSLFVTAFWLLQITHNTLEYTERLDYRQTIADEVTIQLLLRREEEKF